MRGFWLATAAAISLVACAEEQTPSAPDNAPQPAPTPTANPRAEIVPAPDPEALPSALRSGNLSPQQAVGIYLRRIELLDDTGPKLQAVLRVNPDAVSEAQRVKAELGDAQDKGILYGLPILVKDNIETRDMRTTAGSRTLLDNDTGRDAPAVARLRDAGAVILGKTNLSEWANFRSTDSTSGWSAVGGLTRNPHDLSRSACGSSSGSGAAVAAGLAWGALGSETNGSVICPSAMNGIVGFKPTVGLVSRTRVVPISPSQDTIGPMTQTVRGAAMILTAMAGTDEADAATAEADERKTDYVAALDGASLDGVRIGVLRWAQSDYAPEQDVFETALERAEAAGAVLVDIDEADIDISGGDSYLVLKAEFKTSLDAYLATTPDRVGVRSLDDAIAFNVQDDRELTLFSQDIFTQSAETGGMTDEEYLAAKDRVQTATRDAIGRYLEENDVEILISPSSGPAFKIDLIRGDVINSNAGAGWVPAIAGYPHLTVPMGNVSGLPLGLSIIGGKWEDAKVLQMGQAFEDILPPRVIPTFRNSEAESALIADAIATTL